MGIINHQMTKKLQWHKKKIATSHYLDVQNDATFSKYKQPASKITGSKILDLLNQFVWILKFSNL